MKFVLLFWCFAVNITILLSQSYSSDDNWFGEAENNISTCENNTFTESGNITLPKEEYDCYEILLNSSRKSSIFKTSADVQCNRIPEQNATASANVTRNFEVQIFETIHFNESRARWNDIEGLKEQKYFSRNPAVLINVTFEGNWTDCNLTIFYEEFIFEFSKDISVKEGCNLYDSLQRPNSINLYRLQGDLGPEGVDKKSNTEITLHYLHLDTKVGDYLLIGSGTEPFADYAPLFLMTARNDTKIYVDDETAYVALVTGSSDAERIINISCNHTTRGIEIQKPTEKPFGILNSTIICFHNASANFIKNRESNEFIQFQKQFLNEVEYYTEQKVKRKLIDLDSVVVLHELESQPNSSVRQAIIQVKSKNMEESLLTQKHLNAVIKDFIIKNASSVRDLQIRVCLNEKKDKNNYLIYLCFPVFVVFFLTIWAYKQKVFQQQCSSKQDYNEDLIHAEPNPYTTTPKVYQEDEFGRRQTIVPENVLNHSDDIITSFRQSTANAQLRTSDEIHMTDMSEIPSTIHRAGSAVVMPDFMRNPFVTERRRRPSLQPVTDQGNQSDERPSSAVRSEVTDDHVYDSLRRRGEELETQL